MQKPFIVTFAGVPGSSKSIIAHYLSETFGLPLFNNDNIRYEVREDLGLTNLNQAAALKEYTERVDKRRYAMYDYGRSFILDASMDRQWQKVRQELITTNFDWFIVSIDLSQEFLTSLYKKTGRPNAVTELPAYLRQHQEFTAQYMTDVAVSVTDILFQERLKTVGTALASFIASR